jgi:hypothetical protein
MFELCYTDVINCALLLIIQRHIFCNIVNTYRRNIIIENCHHRHRFIFLTRERLLNWRFASWGVTPCSLVHVYASSIIGVDEILVCACIYIYIRVYVCVCVYVYIYVCICIYIIIIIIISKCQTKGPKPLAKRFLHIYVPDYMTSCLSPPQEYWLFPVNYPVYIPDYMTSCLSTRQEYWLFPVNHPVYIPDYMASCLSPPQEYWLFLVNHPVYVPDYMASWSPSWRRQNSDPLFCFKTCERESNKRRNIDRRKTRDISKEPH